MLAVGKFLRCTLCRSGTGLEHAKKGCKGFLLTLLKDPQLLFSKQCPTRVWFALERYHW